MKEVIIYVEGKDDKLFLQAYLEYIFGFEEKEQNKKLTVLKKDATAVQIKVLDGCSKLNTSDIQEQIREELEDELTVLVIIDADNEHNAGGFEVRESAIKKIQNVAPFEFFLIPNHKDDGYLEVLLRNILKEVYQPVLQCIKNQDECLKQVNQQLGEEQKISIAPNKGVDKLIMYSLKKRLKIHKEKTTALYKNEKVWDLKASYLDPLKNFLEKHLMVI